MKTTRNIPRATLTAGLFIAAAPLVASCGGIDCARPRTTDEALSCPTHDETPDAGPPCTPAPGTVCTVIGTGEAGLGADGIPGSRTKIYLPQDVTVAPDGVAYYLDWNNHVIRRYGADGLVRTVAGTGELSDGDATPDSMPSHMAAPALTVRLNHPTNIAFDASGSTMFVAAWHNSEVRRVNMATQIMDVACGTGARSFGGDNGPAEMAALNLPVGIALNPLTNDLFIADQANQRIRRVDSTGTITTVIGTGMAGYAGDDGPALMAQLNNPIGQAAAPAGRIAFDAQGNLYIADTGNHRVRKVNTMGVISTVAGTGMAGASGDGGPANMAQLNGPADVEVGPDGTLYIADTQNSCVRAVGTDGVIRTVAGRCGMRGFTGDGGAAGSALFDRPYGVETDTFGNLWISDTYNQRVRLLCAAANAGPRCSTPAPAPRDS